MSDELPPGGSYGQSYGPPPEGQGPAGFVPVRTAPLAVVSLVLGVLGICCGQLFLVSIGAIVTGAMARRQVAASRGTLGGAPLGLAGLVLGVVGIVVGIAYWVAIATGLIDVDLLTRRTS